MKNKGVKYAIILSAASIVACLLLKRSPTIIVFRYSFADNRSQIFINDDVIFDTLLTSDASTGFSGSETIYATLYDKILIKIDTSYLYIKPGIFKSRYAVYRLRSGKVFIKKIDKDEILIME